ncbi:hypothetical protein TrLO_g10710 [Triparma laevis f. longispina]|uniref:Inositol-1-monophosphatase n=1 Tax=Triparma laevis f. longispina TaxID=1714387 RepID=A0A9W7CDB3_9STRA|nr:hypothetical protein TrLO_g10710 [Triparma laevis f. longispina]
MLASISFVGSAALFTGCARLLQRDVDDAASDEDYHDAVDDLDDVELYSRLLSSDHEYGKHLRVAVEAALVAGRGDYYTHLSTAGTIYSTSLSTTSKSNTSDFFTEVDVANEKLIIERIKASFPSHAIIGEETSDSSTPQTISPPTWIIDPIDGTTNFVAGNALTCVSICYAENDECIIGVVYAPKLNELYIGVKGVGAWLNGIPIRKLNKDVPADIKSCNICVEFGYDRSDGIDAMTNTVATIMRRNVKSIRMLGSGVLDLVFVALGRLDAVYCGVAGEGWQSWDYAAASVILKESGGVIENWKREEGGEWEEGGKFDIFGTSMVCACNEQVLKELKEILNE